MNKHIITKEQAEQIVKEVFTVADFCRKVGWQPRGENYRVFYKYVKDYNLDISHFTGNRTNLGNKNNVGISNEEYFKDNKLIKGSALMRRLINKVGWEYKCECCGISEWNGKSITLQIHHKDGDHLNNTLSNLQILCPNCHSQTKNFAGSSNKSSNHTTKRIPKHTCKCCGKVLHREPKTGLCIDCLKCSRKEGRKVIKPEREVLKSEIRTQSFKALGQKYSVSDKAISKWCKTYKLPYTKRSINSISDEEWNKL